MWSVVVVGIVLVGWWQIWDYFLADECIDDNGLGGFDFYNALPELPIRVLMNREKCD